MTTDGYACTLLFIRNDLYDPLKKAKINHVRKPFNYANTKYVKDLNKSEKMKIKLGTVVGIDPGVDDLLYATSGDTKKVIRSNGLTKLKTTTFRYSRMQRRVETRSRKYANIIEKDKKDKKETKIKKLNIKEIENKLSKVNFNSCILKNIKNNIKLKNKINDKLYEYYKKPLYRQLKWYGYINRIRSESNMMNRFKKTFGEPGKVTIFIGDWSTQKNMRYREPTKGKGFRDLFKKNGYNIFLVDEHNTSIKMHGSGDEMEKCKKIKKDKKTVIVHGLLRNKLTTGIPFIKTEIMNRDLNGSLNIRERGICEFHDIPIPSYLMRQKKNIMKCEKEKPQTKYKKVKKTKKIKKIIKNV